MSKHPALVDEEARIKAVVYANDTPAPLYEDGDGIVYVGGKAGETYHIRVNNISESRVEAIVSIGGKDVIGGLRVTAATKGMVIPTQMTWKCLGWHATKEVCRRFTFPTADADADHVQITIHQEGPEMLALPQASTYVLPGVDGMSTGKRCGATKFTRLATSTLELRIACAQQLVGMELNRL